MSSVVKNMLEGIILFKSDNPNETEVPVPNVRANILNKVI